MTRAFQPVLGAQKFEGRWHGLKARVTNRMTSPSRQFGSQTAGFTIVELLVVIGIIAILAGILLPVLSKSRESANDIACRNNLRQIAIATRMYSTDFDDNIPDAYLLGGANFRRGRGQTNPADPTSVPEVYGPGPLYYELKYLRNEEAWICPSQTEKVKEYKNTYLNHLYWRDPNPQRDTYDEKRTTKRRATYEQAWWIGDNVQYNPFTTGSRKDRFGPNPTIPGEQQLYPHRYRTRLRTGTGRRGSINMCFIDGHVGVIVFNLDGNTDVVRSP